MKIAERLKEENIAEYLLYMWQVEDLIRANECEPEKIEERILSAYPENERARHAEWYANLVEMMCREGVKERGHLQINKNVITNLTELHVSLLSSTRYPYYSAAYFKALPFIVELRRKNGQTGEPELETCFEALYGMLLLRLQKKEITPATQQAMDTIGRFIAQLAECYRKDKKGELNLED